jgi:hypothetical protein
VYNFNLNTWKHFYKCVLYDICLKYVFCECRLFVQILLIAVDLWVLMCHPKVSRVRS